MTHPPTCTCLPGATLWLAQGPAGRAAAQELADRLRTRHHRRVAVLATAPGDVPGESSQAAVRRVGMVAEILAGHGFLAVVAADAERTPARHAVRDRHRRAGLAFLEVATAPGAPATTADALFDLLGANGLVLSG
ncbi:hypothetical protein QWJ26_12020 [Streptomyces sp. CSDS2]|uniref:hypothetical protein n=1 Tax=Streptomyces sp. CSDS2 TaxID=3055051 RepID=UPI0025B07D16|nr:hypothetical protein [Streptomyces sp. CSDS2]MDN3260527.1 hypothetical protein [Streptomyces sp. CSDS2]